jgi:parallel beta-helix repeat protein
MNNGKLYKGMIVIAIAMAFVMPVSAFAHGEAPTVTSGHTNSVTIKSDTPGGVSISGDRRGSLVTTRTLDPTTLMTRGVVYVDDNQVPGWYDHSHVKTIHEGVANATAGDTIFVYNGTYYDHVTVNKMVSLVGESRNAVIVDGSGTGNVLYVTAASVNISSFSVRKGSYGIYVVGPSNNNSITDCDLYGCSSNGIYLSYTNNNSIMNCHVYANGYGIRISASPYNDIVGCEINNSAYGLQLDTVLTNLAWYNNIVDCDLYNTTQQAVRYTELARYNTMTGCNIHDNRGIGIYMYKASYNTFTSCNVYNNRDDGIYVSFSSIGDSFSDFNIYNNTLFGFHTYSQANNFDVLNCNIYDNHGGGIQLGVCQNGYLSGNTLTNNNLNLLVLGSSLSSYYHSIDPSNTIDGKPVYYLVNQSNIVLTEANHFGYLGLISCTNITAMNSVVNGIMLVNTVHSTIINVTSHSNQIGIYLTISSNYNTLMDCDVYNNTQNGIILSGSNNNNLTNCNAYNNIGYGIRLFGSSYNIVTNCTAHNTAVMPGFGYGYGIMFESAANYNTLIDSDAYNNGNTGITLTSNNYVMNCNAYNNVQNGIALGSQGSNNNITNCNAFNNTQNGFHFSYHANNNDLTNCDSHDNGKIGISITSSNINRITNCNIYDNGNYGALLAGCANTRLRGDTFTGNLYNFGVTGSYVQDIDPSNTVDGKNIYYLVSQSNQVLDETDNVGFLGLVSCTNITVKNSDVTGVLLVTTTHSTLQNIASHDYEIGFYLSGSSDDTITDCDAYNNTNYGLYLDSSANTKVRDSAFYDNQYDFGVTGAYVQDIDSSNMVNGKNIYYLVGQSDQVLDETDNVGFVCLVSCSNIMVLNSDTSGVLLVNTDGSVITNVSAHGAMTGIIISGSTNNQITECTAYDNNQGISLVDGSDNAIVDSTAYDNVVGILLGGLPTGNTVSGCEFYGNTGAGISVTTTDILDVANSFIDCVSHENGIGISLVGFSTTVTGCVFNDNLGNGIYFDIPPWGGNDGNEITYCTSSNNDYGIYIYYEEYKMTQPNSHQSPREGLNIFHHNNFIDNAQNAYEGYGWDNPTQTQWDDGSQGNYWSDYTGVDEDGDGIGDTPYDIPDNGYQDMYPLMTPWDTTPPVITDAVATPDVQSINDPVVITCVVVDNIAVGTVMVNISGPTGFIMEPMTNEGSTYSYENVFTTYGVYYCYIWANDSKGNTAVSDVFPFIITEFEKPVSAVAPLPTWKKTVPFSITATAYDNIGVANVSLWYRYSSDGISWTAWTFYGTDGAAPWSWSFSGVDGYYQFYSIAVDTLGNIEDAPATADASTGIDTVKPVTSVQLDGTLGQNGWYIETPVTVTLTASDSLSGVESTWYKIDAGFWTLYSVPFLVGGDGVHTVQYYSFDEAGNSENTKSTTIKIDTTSPTTTHELSGVMGSGGAYASDVMITLSAIDASSGVNSTEFQMDGSGWMTYTTPYIVMADGDHTLQYYSIDIAGNSESTTVVEFTIHHDMVPPETTHVFNGIAGDNGWYISPVVVTLNAQDDSSGVAYTNYKIDDDGWINYTGSFTVTQDGVHAISYYSVDRVGNAETSHDVPLYLDATAPAIQLTATPQNLLKTKWLLVANVSDDTSGVARVVFYVAGELLGNVTTAPYEFLYEGTNSPAQAIVYDSAGNSQISNEVEETSYEINGQQQSIIGGLLGQPLNVSLLRALQ